MINCDCRSIKYNQRETQSPHCKGQRPTWNTALQAIQPPPSPDRPTQPLPQGALRQCSGFVFSVGVELFAPPLGRGEVGPFCFQWAHFNSLVAVSTLLHTLTSWCTHIFNPAHFSEIQGSRRLQETHNWFSSLLPQGLYQTKEGSVPRENGKLHFWSSKTCSWTAVYCDEKERETREEEEEGERRRKEAREERREGAAHKPTFIL